NNAIPLGDGEELLISTENKIGTKGMVYIQYEQFARDVKPGEIVMVDDGKIVLQVLETNGTDLVKVKVINGGILSSKKGVNLPNTKVSMPSLTEKDREDLEFALEHDIEWIALSFVRSALDIIELKHLIAARGKYS